MFINKIEITNFRSIKSRKTIQPKSGSMLVFVGPNNVGKSNFLRAINLFFNKRIEPDVEFLFSKDFYKPSDNKKKTIITLEIEFDSQKDKQITQYIEKNYNDQFKNYLLPITLTISSNKTFQYLFRNKKGQRKSFPDLINRILDYTNCIYIPSIKNYKEIINQEFLKQVITYTFQGWGRGRTSKKIGEQRKKFESNIIEIQKMLDETGFVASDIISNVIPEIKRFHFSLPFDNLEEFLIKLNLEITESNFSERISLDSEGSGIQSFVIYTMLRLIHELQPANSITNSTFIWLIEEPETFMHNDLQRKTKEKLNEYSKDGLIYISTHSPIFISKNELSNVYWVYKNVESELRGVNQKDLANLLSNSLGIKLQDYFIFNRYNVLIEGDSDEFILTNLINIYNKLSYSDIPNIDLIKFFVCKSTSSIPHFYNIYNSFNQFASFYVLVDGDKAGNKAILDLTNNGVDNKYLIQLNNKINKQEPEIEDLLSKDLWESCLKELDRKGIVTLSIKQNKITDYYFDHRDREAFKKEFSKLIVNHAKHDISKFDNYYELLKELNNRFKSE